MASIGDLTATLRANTTDFTAKMDAATASSAKLALSLQDPVAQLRQLGIQAGAASGEMRALLVAQQQSIIEGLKAKGLVIVNGQLAYSATAAAEATTGLAAAETEASVAGAGFMNNASRLERSLGSLVTRMAGIPMQVGSIGVSLGRSILGTSGALMAVGAVSLVFFALSSLIDHFRAAAKAAKEATNAIIADWKRVTLSQEEDAVNQAVANVKAAQAFLAKRQGEFLINAVSQQAVDAARTALTQANQQLDAAEKALQKAHGPSRGYGTAEGTSSSAALPKPPLTPATPFFAGGLPMSTADAIQAIYANLQLQGPKTPGTPFTNSRNPNQAAQLIADYQRDLNSSELRAVVERSGQTLSHAFAQGLVGG
ncbi:MAG TPA: hypothetical protein VLC11_04665, partial [Gemmatimonadales bacterium]|nr:hypothetical protein [Gemmatimonadales bacterium]